MPEILVERRGRTALLRIDRIAARNALSRRMFEAMRSELAGLASDGIRALVVTGSDGVFCSGADLSDPMMGRHLPREEQPAACAETLETLMNALIRDIRDAPFPVVSAVNGVAAGGGVGLALAADIVVAADSARFVLPFVPRLGLIPDLGATWHLARQLGRARAMGTVLLGDPISAQEAVEWGLIWQAVPAGELAATADLLAERLAAGPRRAQLAARGLIDAAFVNDLGTQLTSERDAQASLVAGDEVAEAMAAFAEKRAPDFSRS